jgi:hypothetical protein
MGSKPVLSEAEYIIITSTRLPKWRHKFNLVNLLKGHQVMKTILAIDLGEIKVVLYNFSLIVYKYDNYPTKYTRKKMRK